MPRTGRIASLSGFIHIIARGVNRQKIFLEKRDYVRFLEYTKEVLLKYNVDIVAYCLMSNHIHFLVHENNAERQGESSALMHDLLLRYAMYFNKKYERSGHLFQNRFTSRVVETEKYLLVCMRYIHNNPVKAGIADFDEYPWSSYSAYISETPDAICKTSFVGRLFDNSGVFARFHKHTDTMFDVEMEYAEDHKAPSDAQVKEIVCHFLKSDDPAVIQSLEQKQRKMIIDKLRDIGISVSQISRVTGLSVTAISHRNKHQKGA